MGSCFRFFAKPDMIYLSKPMFRIKVFPPPPPPTTTITYAALGPDGFAAGKNEKVLL